MRRRAAAFVMATSACQIATAALAQSCALDGVRVACADGRAGILNGDSIVWPDGTRSSRSPHPSVTLYNPRSITIGQGVFVGSPGGRGDIPLDDPNAPNKRVCAIVNAIPYCH